MTLNLKQIEAFFWVDRLGGFQAAASYLNTTQPAISARIRELERTLGVQLFDRRSRNARLTSKGRSLLDYAQQMLGVASEIAQRVGNSAALSGLVRLGVADTIALTWLPEMLARVATRLPNLEVDLEVDLSINLHRQLENREIDLAILVRSATTASLNTVELGRVSLAWMCSPTLALPDKPIAPRALAKWPIIAHTRGSHQYVMIRQWFRENGIEPRRISGCSSLSTLIKLVGSGLGLSVLAPATLRREITDGALRVVQTTCAVPPNRFVAARPTDVREDAIGALIDIARETARDDDAFLDR